MLFELIAAAAAGFSAAGLLLLARKVLGAWIPRWIIPASAGAAMILMGGYSEYGWFSRQTSALPDGMIVVMEERETGLLRPWSYIHAPIARFVAIDRANILSRESEQGNLLMVDHYLFARWMAPRKITSVYNCEKRLRADLPQGALLDEDGKLANALWHPLGEEQSAYRALCSQ